MDVCYACQLPRPISRMTIHVAVLCMEAVEDKV